MISPRKLASRARFLSTPSARRATRNGCYHRGYKPISIHALREEGDGKRGLHQRHHPISIHALREEGDLLSRSPLCSRLRFLSTPSARRATIAVAGNSPSVAQFLSTPSARRATLMRSPPALSTSFLSTPSARRATRRRPVQRNLFPISIHALREEGDSTSIAATTRLGDFYPRPPRGGRLCARCPRSGSASYFYPRPPRGGRP